ncbi:MAG: hypothetical protein GX298_11495 [Planctomycetes bacterium]|jgi:predicted double-glycine peptidase|nr:hypothetical protein [Planctomycetota bacterium]
MNLWLETIGVFAVAATGMLLGHIASRSGARSLAAALGVSFLLVGLVLLGRLPAVIYSWPMLYPLAAGRVRFVLLVFAVTLGFSAPLAQLRSPRVRMLVCVMMAMFVSALTILPFVGPAAVQGQLAAIGTQWDADGVCRQSQPFTCGAAAAATALRRLGIEAEEGALAVAARTGPMIGTSVWTLYQALDEQFTPQGVSCSFSMFDRLAAVPHNSVMLAVMRDTAFSDHCVAVLEMTAHTVTLADPAQGLVRLSMEQFMSSWRGSGIVLRRAAEA